MTLLQQKSSSATRYPFGKPVLVGKACKPSVHSGRSQILP